MYRADLRRQIAFEVPGMANVGLQHLQQVLANLTAVVQANRGHAKPLVPDFGGGRIVGAMGGAAYIGMMGPVDCPKAQFGVDENRDERG